MTGLTVDDETDVEARPADIGADDVLLAKERAEEARGHHSSCRPGGERVRRPILRLRGTHRAAHRLHHEQRTLQTTLGQAVLEVAEIAAEQRRDVARLQRWSRFARLLHRRDDLARDRYVEPRRLLLHDLLHPLLMHSVLERPEEADADRLDALGDELIQPPGVRCPR